MRRPLGVLGIALLLVVGMILPATADTDTNTPPSSQHPDRVLDDADLTVDVVCPTTGLPEGVTGVGTIPDGDHEFGGQQRYIVPWAFNGTDHGGLEEFVWTSNDESLDDPVRVGDIDSPGADGNWYPFYPSGPNTAHTIVYTFADTTTWTATATFDGGGCIEDLTWTSDVYEPSADISISFTGDEDLERGEIGSYTAIVENSGDAAAGVRIGVEFTGDIDEGTIVVSESSSEITQVVVDTEANIVFFYGTSEQVDPDTQLVLEFDAQFNDTGSFTGTAYAFDVDLLG